MFSLPSGTIYKHLLNGSKVSVMSVDCESREDFISDLKYLFSMKGFKVDDVINFTYEVNDKVIYKYIED